MKKVAIIIVTHNRLNYLIDLIESIKNQNYKNYKIIVVNNGSTDKTQSFLEQQKEIITINQENCGGAGGFYTGLKYASEQNYDYAWIMDDDVLVKNDSLENLLSQTTIVNGFLCSKVVDTNNKPCNLPGLYEKRQTNGEQEWTDKIENSMIKLSVASFVSVLIPIKIIKEIGLPYKEFFIWGDDTEYTRRISEKYESYLCGKSIVIHRRKNNGILSIFTENDKQRINNYYYLYRNTLFYEKKYSNYYQIIFRYLKVLFDFFRVLLCLKPQKAKIILKAIIASITFKPRVKFPCQE